MTYVAEVTADSPTVWWRLGSNPLLDETGNGNALTLDTGTPVAVASLVNDSGDGARKFTNDTWFYTFADDPDVRATNPMSVEVWGVVDFVPATFGIIHYNTQYEIRAANVGGSAKFAAQYISATGDVWEVISTTVLAVGSLYHVVITVSGTDVKLYVNGALEATTTITSATGPFGTPSGTKRVGRWYGTVDEVAIYHTALSPTRIAAHYAAGTTAPPVLVHGAAQALTAQSAFTGFGHIPGEVPAVAQALSGQSDIVGHGRLKIHAIPQALTAQSSLQQVVVAMTATATDPLAAVGSDTTNFTLSPLTGMRVHTCTFFENRVVFGNAVDDTQQGPDLDVPDIYESQRPPGPVTLGHTYDVARACRIKGVRIWKHPQASGNIVVAMWNAAGVLQKSVPVTWVADAGGWRTVLWDAPVTVAADAEFNVGYYYPTVDDHYGMSYWNWNTGDSFVYPFRIQGFSSLSSGNAGGSWNVRGTGLTYNGGPANRRPASYYVDPIAEWDVDTPAYSGPSYWRQWENGPDPDALEIPIAVWWVNSNRIAEYVPLGMNTVIGDWGYNPDYVRYIKAAGMYWWPFLHENDLSAPIAVQEDPVLAALVKGYFLTDEPDVVRPFYPPAVVRDWKNDARKIDSTRPIWLNLSRYAFENQGFTWQPAGITARNANLQWREYMSLSDIATLDAYSINAAYPFNANVLASAPNRWGIWAYPKQVDWSRKMTEGRCPVWGIVETSSSIPHLPLISEIQRAVWACLIAGATGIEYFQHRFSDADQSQDFASLLTQVELHAGMTALNAQIQSLAAAILAPEANLLASVVSSTTTGPMKGGEVGVPIHSTSRQVAATRYVFAQAIRPGTTTGTFQAASAASKTITVIGESRTVVANGSGVWTDVFDEDYEYHLYQWT